MAKKTADKVRVMLVDDHSVVREGLKNYLGALGDFEVVGEASDGAEALELAAKTKPQVILMDLVMPVMDGIEATRRLHETLPDVKVIVLTSFADDDKLFPALRAGAVAYLLKDVGPNELAEAIKAAARGRRRLHPDVTPAPGCRDLRAAPRRGRRTCSPSGRWTSCAAWRGAGRTRKSAADLFISEKTVKTHVGSILDKLGLADRTQAAIYAVKRGVG